MKLRYLHYLQRVGAAMFIFTILAGCGLRTATPAPTPRTSSAPTMHVTADQIASAMQADQFFADYGQTALIVQGTVKSVAQNAHDDVVTLDTSGPMKVLCHFGDQKPALTVGATITVQSTNQRRDGSNMSMDCQIPAP